MSYPFRIALVVLIGLVALAFLLLGAFELADPTDQAGKASRLFFSLAAICVGCAAGVMFA